MRTKTVSFLFFLYSGRVNQPSLDSKTCRKATGQLVPIQFVVLAIDNTLSLLTASRDHCKEKGRIRATRPPVETESVGLVI